MQSRCRRVIEAFAGNLTLIMQLEAFSFCSFHKLKIKLLLKYLYNYLKIHTVVNSMLLEKILG